MSDAERKQKRGELARPIMEHLKAWMVTYRKCYKLKRHKKVRHCPTLMIPLEGRCLSLILFGLVAIYLPNTCLYTFIILGP